VPTFAFEVMSQAQATSFGVSDGLVIASAFPYGAVVSATFSGANTTISYGGKSLTFGPDFSSQVRELRPDGQAGVIVGTPGGDVITGRSLTTYQPPPGDSIFGGAGDDTLDGGTGSDTLSGGPGADVFVFRDTGDTISDFEPIDKLAFTVDPPTPDHYQEVTFATELQALSYAQGEIRAAHADVVAAQVGSQVIVYIDALNSNTYANSVRLQGATLDQISLANFVKYTGSGAPSTTPPAPGPVDAPPPLTPADHPTPTPVAPAAPDLTVNIKGHSGAVSGDMDLIHFSDLRSVPPTSASDIRYDVSGGGLSLTLGGSSFAYDAHGLLTGGDVGFFRLISAHDPGVSFAINVTSGISITSLGYWEDNDATQAAFATILAKSDSLTGGAGADLIRGFGDNDILAGGGGNDTIWGGTGDDVIYAGNAPGLASAATGATYLRGEEGNDWIGGGDGFDDANGNQGNDTISTGAGNDYCVGGKDDDLLFGDAGNDLVYGNLGADTCEGGDGNDIVRGGQDNDIVRGGAGDDFISGDKGDDTMTGGTGADIFHTFGDAGLDVVTDFNFAEGDRVQLDPGTHYTLKQDGPNLDILMDGGGKMVLLNVPLLSLSPSWIFGA
jgi:Ca2+-binding RTX toxin-like protein